MPSGTDARLPAHSRLPSGERRTSTGWRGKVRRWEEPPLGEPEIGRAYPLPLNLRRSRQRRRGWSCLPGAGRRRADSSLDSAS